jgi:hypothetical protein
METTSDDKQILSIKVLRTFIISGWGMYFPTGRYDYNGWAISSVYSEIIRNRKENIVRSAAIDWNVRET